jgi:hypothetical protein
MDMGGEKYYFKFDDDDAEAVMSENLYQACVHLAHKAEEFNQKWG